MEVGKAKYGSGRNTFKIEDGDNVYRILPALGSLAKKGTWRVYQAVQWGFKNSKNQNKPFLDCRVVNYNTKMVEVESEAYLLREGLKKKKDEVVALFKAGQATKEQVTAANDLVKRFNLDGKHYLNAVNLNGEIGLLKINTKLKNALVGQIDKLRKQGVDPLSVEHGVYFNFFRANETGKVQDYVFQVNPYKENVQAIVNGQETITQMDKIHVMDETFLDRLDGEAFDLATLYPSPTPAEISRMVKEGAPAVDEILGDGEPKSAAKSESPTTNENKNAGGVANEASSAASTPAAEASETDTTSSDAPATQAQDQAADNSANQAQPASGDMSNEDFLKSIGALS